MNDFIPTRDKLPAKGTLVDWIAPSGDQVNGGKYDRLWFLPSDHTVYCYYVPIAWRPAAKPEGAKP